MSIEIKEKLHNTVYVYGPLTKQEAFSVTIPSYATTHDGQWYAGTNSAYEAFADKLLEIEMPLIEEPVVEEPVIDESVIEESQPE